MTLSTSPTFTRTLSDVRDQVAADDSDKWDTIARCHEVTLRHGRLHVPQLSAEGFDSGLALSPWATAQACQKLGIPAAYYKKCPPALQDENFNHWNRHQEIGRRIGSADSDPEGAWLLRAKGSTVRAVLSPRYSKLDNAQLMEALLPLLLQAGGPRFEVGLIQLSPESFHLRLVDPTIARDVLPGDRLMVGVHVANSEVGLRAVTIDALVFRVVCTNGLIRRINSRSLLRQRHLHVSAPRFAGMLADALREAVAVAAGFIEQMALAVRTPVPNIDHAIAQLAEMWGLPKETQEFVRFALHGEAAPDTLYGLTNALTNAAQRLPSMDDRFELEAMAGVLIDIAAARPADAALRSRILQAKH